MQEFEHKIGPRIEGGINFDKDITQHSAFPKVKHREITDPVSDGSLGEGGYSSDQYNKDGGQL